MQRIRNDFAVTVYESHAREAIKSNDLGELHQCLSQLAELYSLGISSPNWDEFVAYRLLYLIIHLLVTNSRVSDRI